MWHARAGTPPPHEKNNGARGGRFRELIPTGGPWGIRSTKLRAPGEQRGPAAERLRTRLIHRATVDASHFHPGIRGRCELRLAQYLTISTSASARANYQ